MSDANKTASSCSSGCSDCKANCSSRKQPAKEDFFVPLNNYSKVKKVIGVVSGKGGVGKSFVTSYLSVLMNRKGYKTAILDADITGPSIPKAFGIHRKAYMTELGIIPETSKNGTKIMSINLLLESEDTPVIWRGPVIAGTVKQFWSDVVWEDVDYMFVDMPPGTGDVPLTVFQSLPVDGLIIVTSPQELVSMIVSKAVNMANTMNIPILGLVENYSYIECGNCKERISVFGTSHIDEIGEKNNLKVLAKIPINPIIAKAIDGEAVEELEGDWLDYLADTLEEVHGVGKPMVKEGDSKEMIIALPTDQQNNVFSYFGKAGSFTLYHIKDKQLTKKETISVSGEVSPITLLKNNKVTDVLCGGIGLPAMEELIASNIRIIPGYNGDADVVTSSYLDSL